MKGPTINGRVVRNKIDDKHHAACMETVAKAGDIGVDAKLRVARERDHGEGASDNVVLGIPREDFGEPT